MSDASDRLPDDVDALKAALLAERAARRDLEARIAGAEAMVAHLKLLIAKFKRDRFDASAERSRKLLDQLEMQLEEVETAAAEDEAAAAQAGTGATTVRSFTRAKPVRGPLPAHLPRERVVAPSPTNCPCCGGKLSKLGESITETLELVPPTVVGIDDWAWRRNRRYGTIICDLERRRTIALLPDREPATAQEWLSGQTQIAVVARDRGGSYALAAAKALPHATQVADRWHLMENASRAFLDAVRTSMRQIRGVLGATTVDPNLLTAAERIQHEGYLRREETNLAILALAKEGAAIKEIVRRTGHSRGLVRKVLRGQHVRRFPGPGAFAGGPPALARGAVDGRAAQRCRTMAPAAAAWLPRLAAGGHGMGDPAPEGGKADCSALGRAPSARTIARLLTIGRERYPSPRRSPWPRSRMACRRWSRPGMIIAAFQGMIRKRSLADLEPWLVRAQASSVASFAAGVTKDLAAVAAAISLPWSNGQTEGQITKLKLVKRQMYGRGKIDLLQARVIGAV